MTDAAEHDHCWHPQKDNPLSRVCCFCGEEQEKRFDWTPDPGHGPHQSYGGDGTDDRGWMEYWVITHRPGDD